jgi:hypothetical protein
MVMTKIYAVRGDFKSAVAFGAKLQDLDPSILQLPLWSNQTGHSIAKEIEE